MPAIATPFAQAYLGTLGRKQGARAGARRTRSVDRSVRPVRANGTNYIFTGALTPSRFRLRASTMRVASHRARRAVCTSASSVSTWQLV